MNQWMYNFWFGLIYFQVLLIFQKLGHQTYGVAYLWAWLISWCLWLLRLNPSQDFSTSKQIQKSLVFLYMYLLSLNTWRGWKRCEITWYLLMTIMFPQYFFQNSSYVLAIPKLTISVHRKCFLIYYNSNCNCFILCLFVSYNTVALVVKVFD